MVVALIDSVVVAVYSLLDGEGARLSGPQAAHAFACNAWSDALTAALCPPVVLTMRGKAAVPEFRRDCGSSAFAGLAAFGGYAIVVRAMAQAPIGAVAPVRECLVVFAAIIGVAPPGEPFRGTRAGAALLIVGGVIALRLA